MSKTTLKEKGRLLEATDASGAGAVRRRIQIITPGWGSSGYYSAEVLQEAATNRVIPAGTHMYLDHASATEEADRPERSVRDIAAVLSEDARWDGEGLVGEAHILGPYAEMIDALAPHIGVSISGSATDVTIGEAEGRTGPIIEGLAHVRSVDFVTHAGRGGKVLELVEAAKVEESRNIGQWIESRIHRDFTITADDMAGEGRLTREERIGLSSAIGDALAAFVASLEANHPQLYARDLWDEPVDTVATAIEALASKEGGLSAVEANKRLRAAVHNARVLREELDKERTKNVSATRPDSTNHITQESQEDPMQQIEEARLRELEEAHGRVPTLESERDTAIRERDEARRELAAERCVARARTLISENEARRNAGITFTTLEERGLLVALPLTEDGALDEDEFTTRVTEAVTERSASSGSVVGFGGTTVHPSGSLTEADIDKAVAGTFGRTVKEA